MTADCKHDVPENRSRVQAGLGLCALTVLAFGAGLAGTIYFCGTMGGGMRMPGSWTMSMMWMRMPGQSWPDAGAMFLEMWLAMMVAMMLPSALPMFFAFYRARHLANERGIMGTTGLMAGGYFLVWTAAGLVIYIAGILFARASMRSEVLSRVTPFLIGAMVLIAGILQFMPWTMRGLRRCRNPLSCGGEHTTHGWWDGWREGLRCGVSCATCCAGPTLVLLALGMMNPAVIGLVAAVIALEKLLPRPELVVRVVGAAAVVAGAIVMGRVALKA